MRPVFLALAVLAVASCHDHGTSEEASVDRAMALRDARIKASQGSTPEFPSLRSDLYCARFAAGAGAPEIEKSCNQQEAAARDEAMAMSAPAITLTYCAKTAEAAGGSYQILKLCVEKEQKSAAEL